MNAGVDAVEKRIAALEQWVKWSWIVALTAVISIASDIALVAILLRAAG